MSPKNAELAKNAEKLKEEFQIAHRKLRAAGQDDEEFELDKNFDHWQKQYDGTILLIQLAEDALEKAIAASEAQLLSISSNVSIIARPVKKLDAIQEWKPWITGLNRDLRMFKMIVPSIGDNWYDDPSGKHQERYRGADDWTDRVRDAGTESIDPL